MKKFTTKDWFLLVLVLGLAWSTVRFVFNLLQSIAP